MLCIMQDGGQYLVAVDESNEHVMSVWDWQKTDCGQKITEVRVSGSAIIITSDQDLTDLW